jgi:hypothetical protein
LRPQMPTSLNHQPEVHHPKSPAIRWAADYPIYAAESESQFRALAAPPRAVCGLMASPWA